MLKCSVCQGRVVLHLSPDPHRDAPMNLTVALPYKNSLGETETALYHRACYHGFVQKRMPLMQHTLQVIEDRLTSIMVFEGPGSAAAMKARNEALYALNALRNQLKDLPIGE